LAEAFDGRGRAYILKGQNDLAIEDLDKAISLNPNFAEAFNDRGVAYRFKNKFDLAIADFDKALALDPDLTVAKNNRADMAKIGAQ
jgi:lipoprotein NlpI